METTPAYSETSWLINQPLARERYLQAASAALTTNHARFARQALLNWLAHYPGDLLAASYYARALIAEGRIPKAVTVLKSLCRIDPEFIEAVKVLLALDQRGDAAPELHLRTTWYVLTGRRKERQLLAPWGDMLASARQALRSGNLPQAEEMLRAALNEAPDQPLVALTHLQLLAQSPKADMKTRREAALRYYQRWPDCLAPMLWLAEWTLATSSPDSREADFAIALLHQVAARDIAGQVIRRLWGENHIYRSLWPERMELALEWPLPAEAAALLGWNLLTACNQGATGQPQSQPSEEVPPSQENQAQDALEPILLDNDRDLESWIWNPILGGKPLAGSMDKHMEGYPEALAALEVTTASPTPAEPPQAPVAEPSQPAEPECATLPLSMPRRTPRYFAKQRKSATDPVQAQELLAIRDELDVLAKRSDLPAVSHLDGRYPVYVIFSVRAALRKAYGDRIAALVESEMNALAQAVQKRHGWTARVFMPDDPSCVTPLGIQAARPGDPWDLKLALADLDCALEQHGERIGALLIVGGPEIVPFHHLPNPIDDQDDDVPSDNPYAALDENYFVPEWPVGRLPGGAGNDARLLIDMLKRATQLHESVAASSSWIAYLGRSLSGWLERLRHVTVRKPGNGSLEGSSEHPAHRPGSVIGSAAIASLKPTRRSFGYTAAVWQKAAALVFRPIGKESSLRISPPFSLNGGGSAQSKDTLPDLEGRLGYFNLHGLVDAPEWYGQSDPLAVGDGPGAMDYDYPVALRPQDIAGGANNGAGNGARCIPQVVFSEACYGLHIQGRSVDQAIALKFMEAGSLAVAGSTCMAYGSITSPLVAADLLGHAFWRFIKDGMPAGEALRQAKLYLVSEMNDRQGYLDGEDQKTLISFVLYGDPLAQPGGGRSNGKNLRTRGKPLAEVKMICDRLTSAASPEPVPHEVMAAVRKAVERYLPGMSDAQITFAHEHAVCSGEGHDCPTHQLECLAELAPDHKSVLTSAPSPTSRSLVMLSKQVPRPEGVHPRIARLTLDERGKLVKLVVSR